MAEQFLQRSGAGEEGKIQGSVSSPPVSPPPPPGAAPRVYDWDVQVKPWRDHINDCLAGLALRILERLGIELFL